jgi:predicted Zn-dependent peptidase
MYKKVLLDNGIPLVMERTAETRSVCIGIWVKVGSRNETTERNGVSHFLEHMFFKGTKVRATKDIAIEIDSLGGELNAFTSRESTTFYVKVLDEHIHKALKLLADIFLNSVFPDEEIRKEKEIICDEINLVEDTPEDYIHDLFNKSVWGDGGLGQSVLGKRDTIANFTRNDLLNYIEQHYGTGSIIVACSGNFEEEKLIEKLNLTVGTLSRSAHYGKEPYAEFRGKINIITKKLSEVHLCMGVKGIPQGSKDRYAMHLLNTILGAGVSSRLFLEVREKRGYAYSIVSFNASYYDTGIWTVYTGTDRKRVREVVEIIVEQMKGLSGSITPEELVKAKNQIKGSLVLALESTSSKMINIARQEMYYRRYFSPGEIISAVESVTLSEVQALSRKLLESSPIALTAYGPVNEKDIPLLTLQCSH